MTIDPWTATIASDAVFGLLAWFRYEQGWQLEDGLADRRFWLTAALPVFLFSVVSAVVTSAVLG
jgi:hypothetical protein